jgi:hypothetical protein
LGNPDDVIGYHHSQSIFLEKSFPHQQNQVLDTHQQSKVRNGLIYPLDGFEGGFG